MPFFSFIGCEYEEEENITVGYQLNEHIASYLLKLKARYKKITIEDIERMFEKDNWPLNQFKRAHANARAPYLYLYLHGECCF